MVSLSNMGMMTSLFIVPRLMMLRCLTMMVCCLFMMLRSFLVMLRDLLVTGSVLLGSHNDVSACYDVESDIFDTDHI